MRKYFFLIISIGTLVMVVVMAKTGATLKTAATPKGILNLEFAYNSDKAKAIINAWQYNGTTDNITVAKINTQLDFIFILFYSAFLYNACKKIAGIFNEAAANTGLLLANGAIAAGLLDIFENIGMLLTLHGYTNSAIPLATFIFSIAKWLLALAALLYFVAGGGWYLVKKFKV
jgi:hypothetical protein